MKRIALVTGGTAGIGKETVRGLARAGLAVVLVGRNHQKCADVAQELCADTGNPDITALTADLSRLDDIRRVAAEFCARHARLDVLVNNAGAIFDTRRVTPDGFEQTFALNHLSYFLLTNLLLDRLTASAPARIVNVSSTAHRFVSGVDFADLQFERKPYAAMTAYGQSKLMNILFSHMLARRLEGTGVTSNSLHPGGVASNFADNTTGWFRLTAKALKWAVGISPARGAETSLYLATSTDVEGVSGKYFERCRVTPASAAATDQVAQTRLWQVSEEAVGQVFPAPAGVTL
ncbi:MAG: SDR family oxidoreductase [Chloracidobacterium sp.]|uniref:SDR family oxidoreductase n=1 Tax=Chloracidobacterium validum TaxID=2821543 RepID=A0ABX8BB39_9BACT|nr:SDR family oxidoreductase [Chloracidobacterium validum]QUW02965.1 SDR family oxidoreductase [Chloracidobacterium validum]